MQVLVKLRSLWRNLWRRQQSASAFSEPSRGIEHRGPQLEPRRTPLLPQRPSVSEMGMMPQPIAGASPLLAVPPTTPVSLQVRYMGVFNPGGIANAKAAATKEAGKEQCKGLQRRRYVPVFLDSLLRVLTPRGFQEILLGPARLRVPNALGPGHMPPGPREWMPLQKGV